MILFRADDKCEDELKFSAFDSENGEKFGSVIFVIHGYCVIITDISADIDDPLIYEGLIRSALNYSANRGVYIAKFLAEHAAEIAGLIGFEPDANGVLCGEIPFLLTGGCSHTRKDLADDQ